MIEGKLEGFPFEGQIEGKNPIEGKIEGKPIEGKIEGKYPFEGVVEAKIEGKEEAKIEGKGPHIEGKVEAKGPFVEGKLEAKPDHWNGHEGKPDHPLHEAKPDHPGPVHDSHPVHNGAPSNHPVHEAKPDSPIHEAKVDEINEHKNGSLSYDSSAEGVKDFPPGSINQPAATRRARTKDIHLGVEADPAFRKVKNKVGLFKKFPRETDSQLITTKVPQGEGATITTPWSDPVQPRYRAKKYQTLCSHDKKKVVVGFDVEEECLEHHSKTD